MLNRPEPSVTADRVFSIRAGLDTSTVTPGMIAPLASWTRPEILAWAAAIPGMRNTATHRYRTILPNRRMGGPPARRVFRPGAADTWIARFSVSREQAHRTDCTTTLRAERRCESNPDGGGHGRAA